jgi:hypothetical protein
MKTVAFSILALAGFTFLFSCKNDAKTNEETQTVVTDSIPAETAPDAMYVTAVSGLTLREFPNLQSAKLAVMPLGTKVKIVNAEGKTTMNVGGIDGAMDEVEYNNKKGFAFNGFMSKFYPPEEDAAAKNYAEELKKDFPKVNYSEETGGTASKPSSFLQYQRRLLFRILKVLTTKPNKTERKRKTILSASYRFHEIATNFRK